MRAVQLTAPGQIEINTIPDAMPGSGQVLVRVAGAGVCGSDLHILGAARPPFPLPLTLGHEAVVIGVGGLGHMALQILRATTACGIIAVDVDDDRLAAAPGYGADLTVRSDDEAAACLCEVTAGRGADAVFDFVGVGPTLRLAAEVVASYGALVVVGLGAGGLPWAASTPPVGLAWETSVVKPYAGTHRELLEVVALAATDRLRATRERHPLEQAPEVFAALRRGDVRGRAVLVP